MKRFLAIILVVLMFALTSCNAIDGVLSDVGIHDHSPEDTPSGSTNSENNQTENNQPENNQPENNQPENNQTENNQTENNQPENNQPENNQPENNQPENNQPENNQPENNQPETDEPTHTHSYAAVVTPPTCTENGYVTYKCSACNDVLDEKTEIASLGHNYVTTVIAPTCDADGYTTYTCTVCAHSYTADVVTKTGHSYNSTVTAPTCTAEGYTTHVCSACGNQYTDGTVAALGHTEKTVAGKAATCTESGLTDGVICSVCTIVITEQHSIPATGHTDVAPTDFVCDVCSTDLCTEHVAKKISGTAPTCTKNGYSDGAICSVCGEILTAQTEIPAVGHNYNSSVTAPTCDADGYTTYTCTVCTHSYTADVVTKIGHSYNSTVTAPTCDADGYTTYTCTVCAHSYTADVVTKTGHSYNSTVTAPTCTAAGYITYTCKTCQSTLSEKTEIAPTGHSYKETVTAPTCTAEGYTTHVCSACGDQYTDGTVAALGHSYKETVTAPTCTAEGYTTHVCSACGNQYTDGTVAALGHTESTVAGKAATCTESGLTDGVICSVCKITITSQTTIAPKNHTYNEKITPATCTDGGYTTYTCTVCTYSYVGAEVDALGHDWAAATTSAPKTCQTCGATEGEKLPSSGSTGSDSGSTSTPTYSTLSVNYINVGQGDSILIKVDNCDILIDGGKSGQGSTVTSYLKSKGVDDIELMINTHPDEDHYGGLTTVLNSYTVEQAWGSSYSKTTSTYTSFKSAVSNEGLSLKTPSVGSVFTYEELTLTVLYNGSGASNSNDSSLVVMLEYGSFRFLFTGDISTTIENKLVSSADLSCDVLKVPHHGSAGSSGASFLSATGADYGVICVGSNSYGHPTDAALSRLSSAGISVYRTDQDGNVVFSTNGATLTLPGGGSVSGGSGSGSTSGGSTSGGTTSGGTSSDTNNDQFIGNTESKVFHLPTCPNLPAASKRNYMYNYWWIINIAGYTPCGRCLKNYVP